MMRVNLAGGCSFQLYGSPSFCKNLTVLLCPHSPQSVSSILHTASSFLLETLELLAFMTLPVSLLGTESPLLVFLAGSSFSIQLLNVVLHTRHWGRKNTNKSTLKDRNPKIGYLTWLGLKVMKKTVFVPVENGILEVKTWSDLKELFKMLLG